MRFLRLVVAALFLSLLLVSLSQAQRGQDKLTRAIALEQSGVQMEAADVYEEYLKDSPTNTTARARLIALLLKMDDKQRALPHINLLHQAEPNNPDYQEFYALLKTYKEKVENTQITDYETRIKQKNCPPGVFLEYSRHLKIRGDERSSLEMMKRYLDLKPGDVTVRMEYAKRLSWRRDFSGAKVQCEKIVAVIPAHPEANSLLGDLLYWTGDEDGALAAYRRGLSGSPNNAELKKKISKIVDQPGYKEKKLTEALQKEPNTPKALELAKIYIDQQRYWEADSLVSGRLEAAPEDNDAKKMQELIAKKQAEQYAKMIAACQVKLKAAPNDTTTLLTLARYYTSQPNLDSALAMYNRYMKLYPLDNHVRMERGKVLMWMGKSSVALDEFRVIYLADPDNSEAAISLAECMIAEDRTPDEAEAIFNKELGHNPDTLRVRLGLADALRKAGRYDEAREQYKAALIADPNNARAKQGLDWLDRDLNPMITRLEKQVKEHPEDLASRRRLAGLYYDIRRYWDAEAQVLFLLDAKKKEGKRDLQLEAFLVDIRAKMEAYRKADLDSLVRYVEAHPEDLEKRLQLADDYASVGRIDDAAAQYNAVIESRPANQEYQVRLGDMYANNGRTKDAIVVYQKLCDDTPGSFTYRFRLAQLHSWMGNYDQATEEYNKALRIDPNSLECQIALADIARWKGDPYAAYDGYSRVLAMSPGNRAAKQALDELRGTFFRGVQFTYAYAYDSESFYLREARGTVSFNIAMRMRAQAGYGRIYFEQKDARSNWWVENGYFLFGQIDYRVDPLTTAMAQGRYYTFYARKSPMLRFEITHDFQDTKDLEGLTGTAYYQQQEAVLDLASTTALRSYTDSLMSYKLGASAHYNYPPKWEFDSDLGLYSVSDGNSRTDFWIEGRRILSRILQVGGRFESVSAKKSPPKPDYWAPLNYKTISIVAQLENSMNRWKYMVHGSFGRVLVTNDAVRSLSAQVEWRMASWAYLSLSLLDLASTRTDGEEYAYHGFSISLTLER